MPLLFLYSLLGITTVGTGFLVFDKGVEKVNDTAQKAVVTGVAIIGLYATYKLIRR